MYYILKGIMFIGYVFFALFVLSLMVLPFLPKRLMSWYIVNIVGRFLFLEGTIHNREKYYHFKNNQDKGVVMFSHSHWFDMIPICHMLGEMSRGVIKSKYLIGPLKIFARRLNLIQVEDTKKGLSGVITDSINNRKRGEDLICISPVGTVNLDTQDIVPQFKSGAFLSIPPILPIIMYYSAFEVWNKQSLFDVIYNRCNGNKLYYYVKVMDPIFALDNESREEYMSRTREYMQQGVLQCKNEQKEQKRESFEYSIKNLCIELTCIFLIFLYERNTFLLFEILYLTLIRVMSNKPQYNLLLFIYIRILLLKMVINYILE